MSAPSGTEAKIRRVFWPGSILGRLGLAAFALNFAAFALVNVVQVPYLRWVLVGASVALTAMARVRDRDRAISVMIVLVLSAVSFVAGALFLAGEVFIGHD